MTEHERFLAFAGFEPVNRVPRRAGYVDALRETVTAYLGEDPRIRFDKEDVSRVNEAEGIACMNSWCVLN